MYTDRYTKIILTLIAFGLLLNAALQLLPVAHAYGMSYGNGTYVRVTNYETDMRKGETLYVYCKNCKSN